MTAVVDSYSDHDMQCPASWENGFKEGIVRRFGDGERALSDAFTGELRGSTFSILFSDHQRRFRQQLAGTTDRFWIHPWTVKMTTRANRAVLGEPYTVFVGYPSEIRFPDPLAMEVTLADYVSAQILNEQFPIPWRMIRDGMLEHLDTVADSLDLESPEPIIYGQHRRFPNESEPSPQGFEWTPIYLGTRTLSPTLYHVWMVAGHACADIPDVFTRDSEGVRTSILSDPEWLIPHTSAAAYEDLLSTPWGGDRRYTLIHGEAGDGSTTADRCATGELTLTCFVEGVEPIGDGTGAVITDRIQQYKHFVINYVVNRGPDSYQSGAWLTTPLHTVFDTPVPMVDEASFDACSAIGVERLPLSEGSPAPDYAAGYIGAGILGTSASDRLLAQTWLAIWNTSCGTRSFWTRLGQYRVVMLHPTEAIKAAAPLYTAAYEILHRSFTPILEWSGKANRVPYRADLEHRTGNWHTAGIFSWDPAITQYGSEILSPNIREYRFAPGITASDHLARMEVLQRKDPPRGAILEATVGPDYNNQSMGYLEPGDYVRYEHFDAVANANQIRLAQVERLQVQAGRRVVQAQLVDCEDLIDFDVPPEEA